MRVVLCMAPSLFGLWLDNNNIITLRIFTSYPLTPSIYFALHGGLPDRMIHMSPDTLFFARWREVTVCVCVCVFPAMDEAAALECQ
jgi:hypothetical protein